MIITDRYQKIVSLTLLIGLLCFLSGFFWQSSFSRLHTLYFILVVLPSLLLIPVFIKEQLHHNQLFIVIVVFCLYSLLSLFWTADFQIDFIAKYLKRVLALLILFYAVYHTLLKYPDSEKIMFILLMLSGSTLASYSITHHIQSSFTGRLELWGGLSDYISSASVYGVLFLLVAKAYLLEKNKYLMLVYLLLALLFILEMMMTQSRGPQLALVLSTPLLFFFIKPVELKRVYYPLIALALFVLALLIFSNIFEVIFARGFHLSYRDLIWQDSINLSLEKPFLGYGLGTTFEFFIPDYEMMVSHSHNVLLSTWLYTGVIGLSLFLSIIVLALKQCVSDKNQPYAFLAVILIFGLLCLLTNGSYPISRANERWFIFWIPLAFIIAHSIISKKQMSTE